jgi:hypothetical protein
MAVVDDDIRLLLLVVHDVYTSEIWPLDIGPTNWTRHKPMSQHAKPQKRQRHSYREEGPANEGGHVGEGKANEAYDKVLEWRCFLDEWRALLNRDEESFSNELVGDDEHFGCCEHEYTSFYVDGTLT